MIWKSSIRFDETRWETGESLTRAPVYIANRSKINARELCKWAKPVFKPVNHVSTSKILEVSKEHAQRKSQAACSRGFSRGVDKPTTRQTSHANDFINRLKTMLLAGWYSLSLPFSIKPLLLDSFFKTSVYRYICCAATDLRKVCMILEFPPLPFAYFLISGCLLWTPHINSNYFWFP